MSDFKYCPYCGKELPQVRVEPIFIDENAGKWGRYCVKPDEGITEYWTVGPDKKLTQPSRSGGKRKEGR